MKLIYYLTGGCFPNANIQYQPITSACNIKGRSRRPIESYEHYKGSVGSISCNHQLTNSDRLQGSIRNPIQLNMVV